MAARYTGAGSAKLARRVRLLNPTAYIDSDCSQALYRCIRVGAADADRAALRLQNTGHSDTDGAIAWNEPPGRIIPARFKIGW